MVKFSKAAALALSLSMVLAASPASSQSGSAAGIWQSEGKEATFEVRMCGDSDTFLCGRLLSLRPDVVNEENSRHLGQTIIDSARPVGNNVWQGAIHYLGHELQGTIVLQSPERIQLNGCVYFVICKTFYLDRAS